MTNIITTSTSLSKSDITLENLKKQSPHTLLKYIKENSDIDINDDKIFVENYQKDWSNIEGHADIVARPKNTYECCLLLFLF